MTVPTAMITADARPREARGEASYKVPQPGLAAKVVWLTVALAVVNLAYAFVAQRNPGFFLVDDNESLFMPMVDHLGSELANGRWPAISERNWSVGLTVGDPQYGLFNPFSMATYWLVHPVDNIEIRVLLIVLLYMNMTVAGVFWAGRSLRVSPPLCALASVSVGLNFFILYWTAAGWTPLLPGFAWFVVAVAALLAALDRPERPCRAVVAGWAVALTFTAGAPYSLLAYVITAVVILACARRSRTHDADSNQRLLIWSLIGGALVGLVPWIVALNYLGRTARESGLFNHGFLVFHLESVLMSFTPSVRPFTGTFSGWKHLDQPISYGSWLFAGAAAILLRWRVRLTSAQLGAFVAGSVLLIGTLGPERFGPFRWSFRLAPFGLVLLVLATVSVLERASSSSVRQAQIKRRTLSGIAIALVIVSWLLLPHTVVPIVTAAVLFVGVPVAMWCVRNRRMDRLALGGIVSGFAVWIVVVGAQPQTTDLIDLGGPRDVATAKEDVRILGAERTLQLIEFMPYDGIRSVLSNNYPMYGSSSGVSITGYTPLRPKGLSELLCMSDPGYVCPDAPARIFEREGTTGLRYVDLFGATQIMVQKGLLQDRFEQSRPDEWTPVAETTWWVLYRNRAAPAKTPVVWMSEGGTAESSGPSTTRVSLPAGGRLVLSQPLWPGTTITVDGVEGELEAVADVFSSATFDEAVAGELSVNRHVPGRGPAAAVGMGGVVILASCAVSAFRRSRPASGAERRDPMPEVRS